MYTTILPVLNIITSSLFLLLNKLIFMLKSVLIKQTKLKNANKLIISEQTVCF